MALTEKEQAFYEGFIKVLESEGINKDTAYRLSEILTLDDFVEKDKESKRVEKYSNVINVAFMEHGDNTPFANAPKALLDEWSDEIINYNGNSNYFDKKGYTPEQKKEGLEAREKINNWINASFKNPFDKNLNLSENHIKSLYKAFQEGRLTKLNLDYTGRGERDNDLSFFYEDEDGSIKLTKPLSEIQSGFAFNIEHLSDREGFHTLVDEERNPELCEYLTKKFGDQIIKDAKLMSQYENPEGPAKPGRFAGLRAVFSKSAREEKKNYDEFQKAKANINKALDEIAKDVFPGIKNAINISKRLENAPVSDSSHDIVFVRGILGAKHRKGVDATIEARIEEVAAGRSDDEKEMIKFALESQYDNRFPKAVKDFIKDIPDIYEKLTYLQDSEDFKDSNLQKTLVTGAKAVETQEMLAKLAIFRILKEEHAEFVASKESGAMHTDLVNRINNGYGKEVIKEFLASSEGKSTLKDEKMVNDIISQPSSNMKKTYRDFLAMIKTVDSSDMNKIKIAKAENERNILVNEQKENAKNIQQKLDNKENDKAVQAARDEKRREMHMAFANPAKKVFSKAEIKAMRDVVAEDYKTRPTAERFANWKVLDASYNLLENKKSKNVSKDSINESIEKVKKRIDKSPNFKKALENGKYKNLREADKNFGGSKPKSNKSPSKKEDKQQNKAKEIELMSLNK